MVRLRLRNAQVSAAPGTRTHGADEFFQLASRCPNSDVFFSECSAPNFPLAAQQTPRSLFSVAYCHQYSGRQTQLFLPKIQELHNTKCSCEYRH